MNKSHKPRGHIWTHASAFQQTKEFRNVDLRDCLSSSAKPFVKDSDELLSGKQRREKRRRIEKLANNFLNGVPLFISSARPTPKQLQSTIRRNQKRSGSVIAEPVIIDRPPEPGRTEPCWVDMEDDDEILERLVKESRETNARSPNSVQFRRTRAVGHVETQAVESRASCKVARPATRRKITTTPSEEALQKAAALRARKVRVPITSGPDADTNAGEMADFADLAISIPAPEEPEKWLSRRKSRFSFSEYAVYDQSEDELCPSKEMKSSASPNIRNAQAPSPEASDLATPLDGPSKVNDSRPIESYHTAPDRTELDQNTLDDVSNRPSPPSKRTRSAELKKAHEDAPHRPRSALGSTSHSRNNSPFVFYKRRSGLQERRSEQSDNAVSESVRAQATPPRDGLSAMEVANDPPLIDADRSQRSQRSQAPLSATAPPPDRGDDDAQATVRASADIQASTINRMNCDDQLRPDNPDALTVETGTYSTMDSDACRDPGPSSTSQVAPAEPSQYWAGTQFLLERAEKDLFVSPEKTSENEATPKPATPSTHGSLVARPSSSTRKALQQLSHERFPNTQQLLGAFEGWSTVKKPRGTVRESLLPISKAGDKLDPESEPMKSSRPSASAPNVQNASFRTSQNATGFELPFSATAPLPSNAEPNEQVSLDWTFNESSISQRNQTMRRISPQAESSSLRGSAASISVKEDVTAGSESSMVFLTSFQAAQASPQQVSKSSNLDDTVDDLRSMLFMSDMHGVLSQVG